MVWESACRSDNNESSTFRFMDKRMNLKLNGGRSVSGILRGFDPFMNVVIDDSIEECKDGTRNNIGMVVRINEGRRIVSRTPLIVSISVPGNPWQQHYNGRSSR